MPCPIDYHEILRCGCLLVGALPSLEPRGDRDIARAAQIYDRRIDLAKRMLNCKRRSIGRERNHRLDPRIPPVRPAAGQFQDGVSAERMTDQSDMLQIKLWRAETRVFR